MEFYNKNSTRDTMDEFRAGGGALDMGSSSFATRSKNGQVMRDSFYMTAWERWSAGLNAS